jgi:PilZ domain
MAPERCFNRGPGGATEKRHFPASHIERPLVKTLNIEREVIMLAQTFHPVREFKKQRIRPERRAGVRFCADRDTSYSFRNPFESLSVKIEDISAQGIKLALSCVIARGTEIAIDFKTKPRGTLLTLLARVIHSSMDADGGWIVDCEFITRPTEAQIRALL